MKTKVLTLSTLAVALSACSNPYSDWDLPNVVRRNQPQPVIKESPKPTQQVQPEFAKPTPKPQPKQLQQVQPEFEKPAPKPQPKQAQQVQPELTKPEVKQAPAPVVEAPKPKPVTVATQPKTQVQPTFEQPRRQPVQVQNYTPRPVMTQAQKEQYPVMPGQNRALKRRR